MTKTATLMMQDAYQAAGNPRPAAAALEHKLETEIMLLLKERTLLQRQLHMTKKLIEQMQLHDNLKSWL